MSDFFRINMPYGITVRQGGYVAAFNRESQPLGVLPRAGQNELIFEKYKEVTQEKLNQLGFDSDSVSVDQKDGSITILFYNDLSNPQHNPQYWDSYNNKLKILSSFIHISQY